MRLYNKEEKHPSLPVISEKHVRKIAKTFT